MEMISIYLKKLPTVLQVNSDGSISDVGTQTAKTRVKLPSGLTQKVIKNMPYVASYNTTFVVCSSMISLKVNPYENVKTNAYVDISSISTLSYNAEWIEASVIKLIYRDLRLHAFKNYHKFILPRNGFNSSFI